LTPSTKTAEFAVEMRIKSRTLLLFLS